MQLENIITQVLVNLNMPIAIFQKDFKKITQDKYNNNNLREDDQT